MKKKLVLQAILALVVMHSSAVEFSFNGKTSGRGSLVYQNEKGYVKSENNSAFLNLSQNLSLKASVNENLYAKIDGDVSLSSGSGFSLNLNELFVCLDGGRSGTYYFGKRNHDVSVASSFSFAPLMYQNNAGFELNVSNDKWFDFNAGFLYNLSSADIKNFNVYLGSRFFNDFISYNVQTFYLHILDYPKGTLSSMFSDKEKFINNIKEYSDNRLEFVTAQTLNYDIKDFSLYVESLIRTNPNKVKVVKDKEGNESLVFNGKKGYFDTTVGFKFDNDTIKTTLEYCYAASGYNHKEISNMKPFLDKKNDTGKLTSRRGSYPVFYDNNIALTFLWNINPLWSISFGDNVSFAGFDCDSSFVGTKFYVGGEYKHNDNFSINAKITGCAGGKNSEYTLFDNTVASFTLGTSLKF